jgi:hypothetical protein
MSNEYDGVTDENIADIEFRAVNSISRHQVLQRDGNKNVELRFVPGAIAEEPYQIYADGKLVNSYRHFSTGAIEFKRILLTAPSKVVLGGGDGLMENNKSEPNTQAGLFAELNEVIERLKYYLDNSQKQSEEKESVTNYNPLAMSEHTLETVFLLLNTPHNCAVTLSNEQRVLLRDYLERINTRCAELEAKADRLNNILTLVVNATKISGGSPGIKKEILYVIDAKILEALRKIEWGGIDQDYEKCPMCFVFNAPGMRDLGSKMGEHTPECKLAAAIDELERRIMINTPGDEEFERFLRAFERASGDQHQRFIDLWSKCPVPTGTWSPGSLRQRTDEIYNSLLEVGENGNID